MLPDRYVKEVKQHRKQRYLQKHILISIILLGTMYLIGPLIHELSHMGWLELQSCYYRTDIGFSFLSGIYGKVKPLCYLSKSSQVVFYSAGYLSTALIGGALILSGEIKEKYSDYILASGIGMMLSVLLTVNTRGDLIQLMEALGVSSGNYLFVSVFITLGVLATSLKAVEELVHNLEREE